MILLAMFTMSGCTKSYKNITTDEISNNILHEDENLQKSDKKMLKRLMVMKHLQFMLKVKIMNQLLNMQVAMKK